MFDNKLNQGNFSIIIESVLQIVFRRKDVHRALFNVSLMSIPKVEGIVLDLGSGGTPSYYRYLNLTDSSRIITVNLIKEASPDIIANLETSLPFKDKCTDTLLAFNIMEHIFDYKTFISECFRVIKKDGKLILYTPFIHKFHPDPDDYFRFTRTAIHKSLSDSGFKEIQITSVGLGPFTTALCQINGLFMSNILIRSLLSSLFIVSWMFDGVITKLSKNYYTVDNYSLGYLCYTKK